MSPNEGIANVLFSEVELKQICADLGKQISKDYEGKNLLLVSVLKGAVVFMADLLKSTLWRFLPIQERKRPGL